jgi:phospholipid/cholesterol/gamma-HCH transport system substrate-binding protein
MNKIKFNKFERVAGLFVGAALFGFIVSMISVAVKQGWFDSKTYWTTSFDSGDGVHPGTSVQIQGLKAGSVEEVDLTSDNKVLVKFYVLNRFESKVKKDSVAQLIRPFVIGERVLDISVGSVEAQVLPPEAFMKSQENVDLMTLMSGRQLGDYLKTMSGMMDNLKFLAEAFLDRNRTQTFINAFDRIEPLLKNLNTMSMEVIKLSKSATKDDNLGLVLKELATTTHELNQILPEMNRQSPQMAKDMSQLVKNLSVLTEEFKVVIPALAEVAPDLPRTSRRAVEALDQAVVLIKAMQKSFFVKSNADEVRKEEAEASNSKKRVPANDK